MLTVESKYQHKGVGTFAVEFAESFLRGKGKKAVCVQTTSDNQFAIRLYNKCGFVETCRVKAISDDVAELSKIVFKKDI